MGNLSDDEVVASRDRCSRGRFDAHAGKVPIRAHRYTRGAILSAGTA
jgi:hypothetical protein